MAGPVIFLVGAMQTERSLAWYGLGIGGICTLLGFLGIWMDLNKGTKVTAAQFTLGLLWVIMAWECMSKTSRTAKVDCAMAELEVRMEHVALRLGDLVTSDTKAMDTLKLRMGAIDGVLSQFVNSGDVYVHAGPAGAAQLERDHLTHVWRMSDEAEITRQVAAFKEHAMHVLYQLIRHGDERDGKLSQLQQAVGEHLGSEDQAMLEQALQGSFAAAEAAVKRLHQHEKGELRLAPAEYTELLQSLDAAMVKAVAFIRNVELRLGSTNTPLTHAEAVRLLHGAETNATTMERAMAFQELKASGASVGDALRRQQGEDGYAGASGRHAQLARSAWQARWEQQLQARTLVARTVDYADRLPERCRGSAAAGRGMLRMLAVAMLVQLGSLFGTLEMLQAASAIVKRRDDGILG